MSSNKAATGGRIAALEAEVERLQNVLRIATEAPRLTGMEALAAENAALKAELDIIANATPSQWEPDMRDQFQAWAQNRARHAVALSATPQPQPAEAGTGGDTQRLAWLASELAMDWEIGGVDVAGLACAHAEDDGRDEPTDADVLAALRRAIDTAIALDQDQNQEQ